MSTINEAIARKKQDGLGLKNKNSEEVNNAVAEQVEADLLPLAAIPDLTEKESLIIDLELLKRNQFLIPQAKFEHNEECKEQSALREECRQIKRKLLNNAFGATSKTLDYSNLIMITSSQKNEGKTFISINLALSIALEQDKTVLLVDADVLKPSIPLELGFNNKPGLIDYLNGDMDSIADIIYETNINNLKILPAGKSHHLANELLASEKMTLLCEELSTRYSDRLVIFDTPPLLGVNETSLLAQLMGQALIVVEENKSSIHEIQQANELLPEHLAKGLVLNKAIHSQQEKYGYYGYGYGHKN
ncbi:XrtA-associated tyrosine autokinase [Thalassotalea sp. ND16A]|uniref:XrtA-associated tyrosine autokinase n=1 Tax=Thalassotalea sp. ND16A TaxID=1535422 RepID=UPI00051A4F49|nr:XrtA-associated tyrosine autokinase [Thalassotalea sp. ND16A]KGJ95967.1 hypothetical protein ND16A_1146 [Thalassotalea sp. ND16A]